MEFREVRPTDLAQTMALYRACAKYHADAGIHQWDDEYPTETIVLNDIDNSQLFGLFDGDQCTGIVAINHDEPKQYAELNWTTKTNEYMIIHRLCTDPSRLRQGLAARLMQEAEQVVLNLGYQSIRLDTYTPNKGAIRFYQKQGYTITGEVYFEKRTDHGYTCFEKELTAIHTN